MITHKAVFAPCPQGKEKVYMQQHAEKTMTKQKGTNKQQNTSVFDIIIPGLTWKIWHCLVEGLLQINTQEA